MHQQPESRSAWPCTTTTRPRTPSRWGRAWPPTIQKNNIAYWSNWSAQAQLLAYIEGNPIYAACNFNYSPEWYDNYGFFANTTATNSIINSFLCPSDGNAGKQGAVGGLGANNSYGGSMGTSTVGYPEATGFPKFDAHFPGRAAEFGDLRLPEELRDRRL